MKPPRRARTRPEIWSETQTALFLSEAKASSPHYPLYLFLVATGVRIGEALGVRWCDLDLNEGMVYIVQALQRPREGGYIVKAPKTDSPQLHATSAARGGGPRSAVGCMPCWAARSTSGVAPYTS